MEGSEIYYFDVLIDPSGFRWPPSTMAMTHRVPKTNAGPSGPVFISFQLPREKRDPAQVGTNVRVRLNSEVYKCARGP